MKISHSGPRMLITIWRWLFHQPTVDTKKWFFRPPKASNDPMTKPFALGRLQVTPSNPPISKRSRVSHSSNTSWPKLSFLQKTGKKCLYFWSQKIAVIQAKLFLIKFFSKKVEFFNVEERKYQTLFVDWMTSIRLFHSQERFAIDHLCGEKIKFLWSKMTCFDATFSHFGNLSMKLELFN